MCDINQPLFTEQTPRLPNPSKGPEPNPPDTPPPTPPGGYRCNLGPEPPRPLDPRSGLPASPYRQREDFVLPEPSDAKTGYTPPQSPQPPPQPPNTPQKRGGDIPLPEPSDAKTGTTPPPRPKTPPNTPKKCSADCSSYTPSPSSGMIYVTACA